ncbi:MAG TPA: DUF885 domain-containing protein [Acidimicrobiia bacterium]|nr:DUF885 domain-containing protein [Acidimicrobiia bacterium]
MNDSLSRLATDYWEHQLEVGPTRALLLGDHRYDDRHESVSRAAEDARISTLRAFARDAEAIDEAGLTADERITRDVLIQTARAEADHVAARLTEIAVNHAVGVQALLPVEIPQLPITEPEHADRLVGKYRAIARMFRELAGRIREGVASGRSPVDLHVDRTVAFIDGYLASDVAADPYLRVRVPGAFDAEAEAAWKERLAEVIVEEIRPAYAAFRDVIHGEARPVARSIDRPGLVTVPGGEAAYRAAIRRYVTLALEPEGIHRVGLEQVERLAEEYRALGGSVLGTSDLAEIFDRLRNDPDLHFTDGPSVVAAAERALRRAKERMVEWFGRLPEADCRVSETSTGPIAFYYPPAEDGSRPGTFFVNTSRPQDWGTFQIESMAYHEGIPGHHLQLAIAQELDTVPAFRRHASISAYAEGWGLYAERLADEMGLYAGDLDRFGMLWGDSMRACRLVVDTGMHALGWSRQQAVDYIVENSPMAVGQIEAEVDRYIGMPGQALSYMIGRLEIDRLRADAEAAMGARFELAGFHDVVIGSGMVPLTTLGRMVSEWAA